MAAATIDALVFSVEGLRRDADEIEGCGGGNEAAQMRWAAGEIDQLRSVLRDTLKDFEAWSAIRGGNGTYQPRIDAIAAVLNTK